MNDYSSVFDHVLFNYNFPKPINSKIQVNHDRVNNCLILKIPIFSTYGNIPKNVYKYVSSRFGFSFKPYSTRFEIEGGEVYLIQEIPLNWDFQASYRKHIVEFWRMAKQSHKMLKEIAAEEKFQRMVSLDSDLEE